MRELSIEFKLEAYLVSLLVAVVLPLLAMIAPVANSLSVQLRDALDVFRDKVSELTVVFSKIEDIYGLSLG